MNRSRLAMNTASDRTPMTAVRPAPSSARSGTRTSSKISRPVPPARTPIAGSGSTLMPAVLDSTTNSAGPWPSRSAATMNSSPSLARGTSDLTPSIM